MIMRFANQFLKIPSVCLVLFCVGCRPAPDFDAFRREILSLHQKAIAAQFNHYLNSTTFTEYRDVRQPIVGFSKDGSLAWSIVQVKVAGIDRAESGAARDFDITWAWITLYERKGDRWIRLGEVSNFNQAS